MTGHVFIYGGIGSGPGETSLKSVKAQLDPQAENYIVHLVSPGGEVFEGFGIYNILKNSGKKITTHIEGVCASIATLIAFAGDEIVMNKTSEFMIHNPNISDLKGDASANSPMGSTCSPDPSAFLITGPLPGGVVSPTVFMASSLSLRKSCSMVFTRF